MGIAGGLRRLETGAVDWHSGRTGAFYALFSRRQDGPQFPLRPYTLLRGRDGCVRGEGRERQKTGEENP